MVWISRLRINFPGLIGTRNEISQCLRMCRNRRTLIIHLSKRFPASCSRWRGITETPTGILIASV